MDVAKKGQEVCVKIEPIPGESPKMFGRHFEATDILVSKVSISAKVAHFKQQGITLLGSPVPSSPLGFSLIVESDGTGSPIRA